MDNLTVQKLITQYSEDRGDSFPLLIELQDDKMKVSCLETGQFVFHQIEDPEIACIDHCIALTPELYKHKNCGYTLNEFSEFFIYLDEFDRGLDEHSGMIGDANYEVQEISPLADYLYYPLYNDECHPDWDNMASIKIYGVGKNIVESYLLNILLRLREKYGERLMLISFDDFSFDDGEPEGVPTVIDIKRAYTDTEALRLFYTGVISNEDENAFLQFFRVIEYYSVMSLHADVDSLRKDSAIDSKEFIKKIGKLINRNEEQPLIRLIREISDDEILRKAKEHGLISSEDEEILAKELYSLRNSIVHAKYDMRSVIHARSLFDSSNKISFWRYCAEELASRAIRKIGKYVEK